MESDTHENSIFIELISYMLCASQEFIQFSLTGFTVVLIHNDTAVYPKVIQLRFNRE